MAESVHQLIGTDGGLRFEFTFEPAGESVRGPLWGKAMVYLGEDCVWMTSDDDPKNQRFVEWDWLDLLEFLAESWPWLTLEENYPIKINPTYPSGMVNAAAQRWEAMDWVGTEREEEALYLFQERHDLSMGLKGIFLQPVFMLRQGHQMVVSSPELNTSLVLPLHEVRSTLNQVGDFLASRITGVSDSRSQSVLHLWKQRDQRASGSFFEIRSGFSWENRKRLGEGDNAEAFWEVDASDLDSDSELLAVARMGAGVVDLESQKRLFEVIRLHPAVQTQHLDGLTRQFLIEFDESGQPYTQGYWAAKWLRGALGKADIEYIEVEDLLQQWGVIIDEIELSTSFVDAVAAWGRQHGPVVLLNQHSGARGSSVHGRRSSLAHEICHLLIDRQDALPAGEVFGGRTPNYVEQRARAFAAEFLLPRSVVSQYVAESSKIANAIDELSRNYKVSRELVANQVYNSDVRNSLNEAELEYLEGCGSFSRH